MAPTLYPFRFKDPVTGKWVKARYRASREDIAGRYANAEIIGGAVIERPASAGFSPYPNAAGPSRRTTPDEPPSLLDLPLHDTFERTLVAAFLRRYVTYCARRHRYAAMNGAARLLRRVQHAPAADPVRAG